jgi:hypothetical protein
LLAPLAAVVLLVSVPVAASGDPNNPDGPQPASGALQDQLAAATRAYVDAKARLGTAVANQHRSSVPQLANAKIRVAELRDEVNVVVAVTYRAGPLSLAIMLDSRS